MKSVMTEEARCNHKAMIINKYLHLIEMLTMLANVGSAIKIGNDDSKEKLIYPLLTERAVSDMMQKLAIFIDVIELEQLYTSTTMFKKDSRYHKLSSVEEAQVYLNFVYRKESDNIEHSKFHYMVDTYPFRAHHVEENEDGDTDVSGFCFETNLYNVDISMAQNITTRLEKIKMSLPQQPKSDCCGIPEKRTKCS